MTPGKLKSLFSLPDTLPASFFFFFLFFFFFSPSQNFFSWMMYDGSLERRHAVRTDCSASLPKCFMDCGPKPTYHRLAPRQPPPDPHGARHSSAHSFSQPLLGPRPGPGTLRFFRLEKLDRSASVPLLHTFPAR